MKKLTILIMIVSTFALSACQTYQGRGNKQLVGTGGGALAGGLIGSRVGGGSGQLWATGAGVLIGALIGSEIGRSLDNADKQQMSHATNQAYSAPIGEPISWNNPNSGNAGNVVATREGNTASGKYCREYQHTIFVGGKKESAYGTACQQPDGSWQLVN